MAARTLYGGSYSQMAVTFAQFGIDTTFVDPDEPAQFRAALQSNTKALYVETIGNPQLNVVDLAALADELRLDTQALGVVIVSIAEGSTAQSVGFRRGDIVVSVNNQKIERSADLDRVTRAGGRQWRVTIDRGGQQISVMFSG